MNAENIFLIFLAFLFMMLQIKKKNLIITQPACQQGPILNVCSDRICFDILKRKKIVWF